jgi:ABC-type Fe3+ transport system substrate-binding protein
MQWCEYTYGFVVAAAPVVFIDQSPTSPNAAAALTSFLLTKRIAVPPNLDPNERIEYLRVA